MITICQKLQGYVDLAHDMLCAHSRTKYQSSSTSCILALSDYVSSCESFSNFHLPCCVINSLHAGQWAQGYAGNFEQRRCNCCTDGMFDNMHNNQLTEVVVHSTQAGHESWPSWCAAQKIVALAREWAEDRNWQTHFSTAVTQEAGFRFYLSMKKQSHFVMLVENLVFSIDLFLPSQFLRQEANGIWHSSFCVNERSNCKSTTTKSLS
jgi:hypothetical protein